MCILKNMYLHITLYIMILIIEFITNLPIEKYKYLHDE